MGVPYFIQQSYRDVVMSGVINNGVQWEHCNECSAWVRLEELGFQPFSEKWKGPCDICIECAKQAPNTQDIVPGKNWEAYTQLHA